MYLLHNILNEIIIFNKWYYIIFKINYKIILLNLKFNILIEL